MESMEIHRNYLKAGRWDEWANTESDQKKQIPPPSIQKAIPDSTKLVELIDPKDLMVGKVPLIEAIGQRKSRREFTDESLTLEELTFLLWATQGVREVFGGGNFTRRTVPSGGSRHPFESYLLINRVDGNEPGLYRYLPLDHKLCLLSTDIRKSEKISDACRGQTFVGSGAVIFIWTVIPYRAEWRYSIVAHKMIALDAGHLCQNLYLASEAIGAGTCAIGSYNQEEIDSLVGVDGEDEFVIYIAPVGKIR